MADQPAPLPPLEPLEPLERKRSADALEAPSKAQRGPAETLAARLRALGLGPGVDDACARVLKTPHESIIEDWRNTSLGLFDPTSTVTVDFVDDEPTLRVGGDPTEQAAMRLAIAGTAGYDGSLGSLIVEAAEGDGEPKAGLGSTAEPTPSRGSPPSAASWRRSCWPRCRTAARALRTFSPRWSSGR
jgi:hypothetical protein